MLHYVGYGYQKRGCPLWLVRGLESWKRKNLTHGLLVMFHELYAFGAPWRSSFWNSPLQRWITARLARLSDICRSSNGLAATQLARMAPARSGQIEVLPVFSNFGEPACVERLQSRPPRGVIYVAASKRTNRWRKRRTTLERACRHLAIKEVVLFGAAGFELDIAGIRVERQPALSAKDASALLSQSRIGILDYPDYCLGKSGIFASYCAHGLVPVLLSSSHSGADEVQLGTHYIRIPDIDAPVPLFLQQQLANNALAWYKQHNLAATAHSVAAALQRLL